MRKKKSLLRILLLVIIIAIVSVLYFNNFKSKRALDIKKWDNLYNEDNILLFYEDISGIDKNESLKNLNSVYKVKELTSKGNSEIEKVLKCIDILNSIVEYDDVADSNITDGYKIIKGKKTSKKVCGREMATIARDLITISGYNCRVGEFRVSNPQLSKSSSFYVVEYYSTEEKKWVMIDIRNRAYYSKDKKKLSAVEVLNSKYSDLKYNGRSKYSEVKNEFKRCLSSYTIAIDNTVEMKKSNSYLTLISSKSDIDMKKGNTYLSPTIYTEKTDLFMQKPEEKIKGKDKKSYLILMKKKENTKKDVLTYIIGAFKDDSVINNYYIKLNNGEWKQVKTYYYNYDFKTGKNTIELSLDGKESVSTVEIYKSE